MRFLLFSLALPAEDHNRQRAAVMPVMVGMMVVCAMGVMNSLEAHKTIRAQNRDAFITDLPNHCQMSFVYPIIVLIIIAVCDLCVT